MINTLKILKQYLTSNILNSSNVTAIENNLISPKGISDGTKMSGILDMNSNKKDTNVSSSSEEEEVFFQKIENGANVINHHETTDLPEYEKKGETTETGSLTKSSPSMLNELADAIIAENFDALNDAKEPHILPILSSGKDAGIY